MTDSTGRTALVCTADERVVKAVRDAGFRVTPALSSDDALPRVRHDVWSVVVVDGTTDLATLTYLHGLPGLRRRELFVVKIGERHATGDRFDAWSESVDLVVQRNDTENIGVLVEEWMHDKNGFYDRFRGILSESGGRLGAHA